MRVIAIKAGYDGVQFRDPEAMEDGHPVVFDMPAHSDDDRDKAAHWYVECDESGRPLVPLPEKPKPLKGRIGVPGQGPAPGSMTKEPNKALSAGFGMTHAPQV